MQKEFTRYAKEGNQLIEEHAVYIKAGTQGLEEDDPRVHDLPDEDGKWLAFMVGGYLGERDSYDPTKPHDTQPLRSGVQVISKEDFDREMASGQAQIDQRNAEIVAKLKAKDEMLSTAFKDGKLYGGDKELFMAIHGFDPDETRTA